MSSDVQTYCESVCFLLTGNLENFVKPEKKQTLITCMYVVAFCAISHTCVEFCLFRFGHSRASSQISTNSTLSL